MDHRILRAERASDALATLGAEDVAVVLSDQRMPGMAGTELLARSREVAPDAVRILLTAFTDADALMDSINAAGVHRFLLKPWDPKELCHVVAGAVEQHRLARERDPAAPRPRREERRAGARAGASPGRAGRPGARGDAARAAPAIRLAALGRTLAVANPAGRSFPVNGERPRSSSPTSRASPDSWSRRRRRW